MRDARGKVVAASKKRDNRVVVENTMLNEKATMSCTFLLSRWPATLAYTLGSSVRYTEVAETCDPSVIWALIAYLHHGSCVCGMSENNQQHKNT